MKDEGQNVVRIEWLPVFLANKLSEVRSLIASGGEFFDSATRTDLFQKERELEAGLALLRERAAAEEKPKKKKKEELVTVYTVEHPTPKRRGRPRTRDLPEALAADSDPPPPILLEEDVERTYDANGATAG